MDSSSSSTKMKTKLSVRNQTCFKKSSFSSTIPAAKKNTNLCMREQTILNKAHELSTLCDIQVCVLYYGPDGELIKTWPEDQSKVRDMAQRFSKLSDKEKRKKSTNLSQFLNKKINDEKKKSLDKNDNKFSQKLLEMEYALENRLQILQDKLRLLHPQNQTKPDQSLADLSECGASRTEQNQNFTDSSGFFSTELPSALINDPLMSLSDCGASRAEQNQNFTDSFGFFSTELSSALINDPLMSLSDCGASRAEQNQNCTDSSGFLSTNLSSSLISDPLMNSLIPQQSNFSIFIYNHDNGSFSQLGAQGFGCSNNLVIPPQMQTQNPLLHSDQFAAWNQNQTLGQHFLL